MKKINRRSFIKIAGSAAAVSAVGFPAIAAAAGKKKVVIVGGGVGGATAAKYIRRADSSVEVTLIEPNKHYYTCFMSNEVIGGGRSMDSIKFGYDGLAKHGVTVVHDTVTAIDAKGQKVSTKGGKSFAYDRCIVAPGISFADNFFPDRSVARWNAQLADLKKAAGKCQTDATLIPDGRLGGHFEWVCEDARIAGSLTMTPVDAGAVQELRLLLVQRGAGGRELITDLDFH